MMKSVTCTGPVNIAVIKYWGKRDEKLILPWNSSISVTLNQDQLRAKTTVAVSPDFTDDRIWLNGVEQDINNARLQSVINEVKRRASSEPEPKAKKRKGRSPRRKAKKQKGSGSDDEFDGNLHIVSENNFPTAAGLASSAAGYGCLVYTLAKLYNVSGELSDTARLGSGSACRSMYGGFVIWDKGTKADGSDSIARQIVPHTHWPELSLLILVVSDQTKHTSSTAGMQTTVETSSLFQQRLSTLAEKEKQTIEAILNRNFTTFAEITMKESNQMHAVCLDSYPPIAYMTDTSHQIVRLVHQYNTVKDRIKVAYTFDAGPNACLFMLEEDIPEFYSLVKHFFLSENGNSTVHGLPVNEQNLTHVDVSKYGIEKQNGSVKYVIHTKPGPGPREVLESSESLINDEGLPKSVPIKTGLDKVINKNSRCYKKRR